MSLIDPYTTKFFGKWYVDENRQKDFQIPESSEKFKQTDPLLDILIYDTENIFQMENPLEIVNRLLNEELIEDNPKLFEKAYLSLLRYFAFNIENREKVITIISLLITEEGEKREEIIEFLHGSDLVSKTETVFKYVNMKSDFQKLKDLL